MNKKLIELRERLGLTKNQVSELAKVSLSTLERAENGSDISINKAKNIATVFGVDLEELFPCPKGKLVGPEKPFTSKSGSLEKLGSWQ